ncbi:MAG TPA: hypothetical protein PLO27_08940, partial [Marmoricola sp.]|nr:hypothetical protein [Marmoricola sp.]
PGAPITSKPALQSLATALNQREVRIRRLTNNLTDASDVFAAQSQDLRTTLTSLTQLSDSVNSFITNNRKLLAQNLAGAGTIAQTVRNRQASLEETFNTMPTGAQNQAMALDRKSRNLRVLIEIRNTLVFSQTWRRTFCPTVPFCNLLFNQTNTGLLDLFFDQFVETIPNE